jgi:uncharacterized membrane protein YfcA
MTPETALYVAAGALAGGLINGMAGFGTALFALGFFLNVMPPVQAVAVVVVLSVFTGVQGLWVVRHAIGANKRRLARFLILYGGYFSLRAQLPRFERPTPIWDMIVGFSGGVLGGAASLSGALPMMWCALRPWAKSETRAVLQPFNVTVLTLTAAALALKGAYTRETLIYLALALPLSGVAAQIGIAIFKRLHDAAFRRLLIAITLVSGLVLLLRELA